MQIDSSLAPRRRLVALALLVAAPFAAMADNTVTVTVSGGTVVLSPDPVPVGASPNAVITWVIATPGWHFAGSGIDIPDGAGEFSAPSVSADGRSVKETDKDDNATGYAYSVTLTNGSESLETDPTIQNGGHPPGS